MRLSASEQRTLAIVAVLMAAVLLWAFLSSPEKKEAASGPEGAGSALTADEARALLAQAPMLRRDYEALLKEAKAAETHLIPETGADLGRIALLARVERIADGAGLSLDTLAPVNQGVAPPEVAVEISGNGDADTAGRFLAGLSRSKIWLSVRQLEISAGAGHTLQVHAVISTYLPRYQGGGADE